MKRCSFFTKLLLGNLLLIGVIVVVSGIASYRYLNANYQNRMESQQNRTVRLMQHYFSQCWSNGAGAIDAECKTLFSDTSMRLTVIAADGLVLADSQADPNTMVNHKTPDRPEVLAALEGKSGRHVRTSDTTGVAYRYFAEPIEADKRIAGAVRVAMPIQAMAEGSSLIRNSLFWSACMAGITAVALAFMLSWIWYSPLRRITRTARRIASGQLDGRVRISGSDELAQLGRALNDMAGSLADKIRQVDIQRGNLETVVRNLREGVVALDGRGRVVVINAAAYKLLDVEQGKDAPGRQLQEVVRIADIVTALNQVMAFGEPVTKRIEMATGDRSKTLQLLAVRVSEPSAEGIRFMLVVRDVTELDRTARVRSEFAANASHELRTPLATIRAAVDSLESLGPDNWDDFEKIRDMLDRHTSRLEDMTNDLLNLHMIETARQQLRLEDISAGSLTQWAQEHFSQRAGQGAVALDARAENPSAVFESDRKLLHLILQNLIENAIKFTPAAGRVTCMLKVGEDHLLVIVSDTGCGIPPELQDRVFERFFQVEPSRSGNAKARGTGLGLAIVKHAVERLRGKVTLRSEPGSGTVVEVTVPVSTARAGLSG